MLYREGEPSQAQIAREIGVKPQTIAPVLRKVRRDAPTADVIVEVAREWWLRRDYAKVRWNEALRDTRGLKPTDRLVHAFLMHEAGGSQPRRSWTNVQMGQLLGISPKNVGRKVKRLEGAGLLKVVRGKRGRPSVYDMDPSSEVVDSEEGVSETRTETQGVSCNGYAQTMSERSMEHVQIGGSGMSEWTADHGSTGGPPKYLRAHQRTIDRQAKTITCGDRFRNADALHLCAGLGDALRVPDGSNVAYRGVHGRR